MKHLAKRFLHCAWLMSHGRLPTSNLSVVDSLAHHVWTLRTVQYSTVPLCSEGEKNRRNFFLSLRHSSRPRWYLPGVGEGGRGEGREPFFSLVAKGVISLDDVTRSGVWRK